jgi:hypothetical protein
MDRTNRLKNINMYVKIIARIKEIEAGNSKKRGLIIKNYE